MINSFLIPGRKSKEEIDKHKHKQFSQRCSVVVFVLEVLHIELTVLMIYLNIEDLLMVLKYHCHDSA